ncbi:MAG: hypothetical protein KF781_00445 [Chitinophagaceae bacterium]|nr:hypothetical protein [Chitinophagaceae bacterium]MCW5905203.1 hypothetical protein [Chitinophagaceae bacterium]
MNLLLKKKKLKLKPTENNKEALRHILNSVDGEEFKGYSKIIENFDFFSSAINAENYEVIQRGLSKLIFVDNPKNEPDKLIRTQLEYINKLEINVAFPFLMKVYEDFSNDIIDKETFISVLSTVQSFIYSQYKNLYCKGQAFSVSQEIQKR